MKLDKRQKNSKYGKAFKENTNTKSKKAHSMNSESKESKYKKENAIKKGNPENEKSTGKREYINTNKKQISENKNTLRTKAEHKKVDFQGKNKRDFRYKNISAISMVEEKGQNKSSRHLGNPQEYPQESYQNSKHYSKKTSAYNEKTGKRSDNYSKNHHKKDETQHLDPYQNKNNSKISNDEKIRAQQKNFKANNTKTNTVKTNTVKTINTKTNTIKTKNPKSNNNKTYNSTANNSRTNNNIRNENTGNKHNNGPCPVAFQCGGCKWIQQTYQEQLQQKEDWLKSLVGSFCSLEPIIGMENPFYYRNKVHAVFGEDRRHQVISGIYEKGTHNIVPVDSCLIENQKADEIIVSIRKLLTSFKIRPFNEDTGYGLLRHVLVRTGHTTGEIMVVLVLSSPVLPSKNNFVKALCKLHPEITTIVININNRNTNMILGEKEQVIYGKGYIEDCLCDKTFRISPKSFYQVNSVQTEKLYKKALEYASLTGQEIVVDAYCGTGTIGIIASEQAGEVIGVELNADAVRDARINAKRNHVKNIQFYQNDAGKVLVEMAEQQAKVDVVLLDPPRSGSSEEFLQSVARLKPEKVIYISCNPRTLVRDLQYLKQKGYAAVRAVGVDLFPFTEHVETACLLVRKP